MKSGCTWLNASLFGQKATGGGKNDIYAAMQARFDFDNDMTRTKNNKTTILMIIIHTFVNVSCISQ